MYIGAIQGVRHAKKGSVEQSNFHIVRIDAEHEANARAVLATVTNQSRIYIMAHGIPYTVHHLLFSGSMTHDASGRLVVSGEIDSAKNIAAFLRDALTHHSLKDASSSRRLRISLLVCYGGMGIEEHKAYIGPLPTGGHVDNPAFAQAPIDNFEASFAVMICAQLYNSGAGIICDVVGRRDLVHSHAPSAAGIKKLSLTPDIMNKNLQKMVAAGEDRGTHYKACRMEIDKNFKSLNSGSLKFVATPSDAGEIVFYDEYEDFFYSFIKHSIIPTIRMSKLKSPKQTIVPGKLVTPPSAEDIETVYHCIEELEIAAQEILHDQVSRGEGEERLSRELAIETSDKHKSATKLSRSPDAVNADYLRVATILDAAVHTAKSDGTIQLLRLIQNKTRLFALAMGATDAPECL
ncbi:MAG: hypothetical protein K0U29_00475 [Gammaproteobacteria bacterium]|nr:hypothetical protein [Gammaproteobacteria bacterium]